MEFPFRQINLRFFQIHLHEPGDLASDNAYHDLQSLFIKRINESSTEAPTAFLVDLPINRDHFPFVRYPKASPVLLRFLALNFD